MLTKPIHPALVMLFRLNVRAKVRRAFRGLRSVKGVLALCLVVGLLAMMLGPMLVVGSYHQLASPTAIRSLAPIGILVYCFASLLMMKSDRGIPFLPAEVDFLFPGPFPRRQLLMYKLAGAVLGSLGIGLMISLYLRPSVKFWFAGFVGACLVMFFVQVFQMAGSLVAATMAERTYTTTRKLVLAVVAIAIAWGLAAALRSVEAINFMSIATELRQSWAGICLLAPFEVFGRTLAAETIFPGLVGWGAGALALNAGMVAIILRLDANFLETSMRASQHRQERIQQARRGSIFGSYQKRGTLRRIPQLPALGGAGPIAWRQLMTAIRSARGMILLLVIMGVVMVPSLVLGGNISLTTMTPILSMAATMSLIMLPQVIRFDFRGDVDRIETLKTLPTTSTAIVVGQLLAPIAIATILQCLLIAILAALTQDFPAMYWLALPITLPVNLLVFGWENFVFLLFPYRTGTGVAELQSFVRLMVIQFLKMLVLFIAVGCAVGVGFGAYFLTGQSIVAGGIAGWLATSVLALTLIPACVWAYDRFDPSTDTPP
jgi:hypothetical protein